MSTPEALLPVEAIPPSVAAAHGDGSAGSEPSSWDWDELFERLSGPLVALGQRRYRLTREDCEDALLKAAQEVSSSSSVVRNPEGFLTTAFLHHCFHVKQRNDTRSRTEIEGIDVEAFTSDPSEKLSAALSVHRAFTLIPQHCREILIQRYVVGRNVSEAGRHLGWSKRTVHRRFDRCVERFTHAVG
ncbi:MAG: sigma-70 family RNA polymerase sigma factor [Acidobacteria bacterium]|nr:sigma-70 family RNA polymerase sigma factor [Acidobacteriota bacterium]